MKKILTVLVVLAFLLPVFALAQEKGTVSSYDSGSRTVTIKGKDWEKKAKVGKDMAGEKADLLKEGAKVTVEFDDRGGGDVRVKSIEPR